MVGDQDLQYWNTPERKWNAFLDDFIYRLPGVSQVRSNIVLKEIKADTALPFG